MGVPFVHDQKPNIARAVKRGYALSLNWDSLTTEHMVSSIKRALQDEDIKAKMEQTHRLYVDRQNSPRETAAWWVDYVVRNRGAGFLKNGGQHVPWYQYHHVDVVCFLLSILTVCLLTIHLFCRYVYKHSYLIVYSQKEHIQ